MDVTASSRTHLSSRDAWSEIGQALYSDGISDRCAVTIASWYQSAGVWGSPFAELASVGRVDADNVLGAIAYARGSVDHEDHKALDALVVWVFDKVRDQQMS